MPTEPTPRPSFAMRHLREIFLATRVAMWLAGSTPRPVGRLVAEAASLGLRRITAHRCRANMRAFFPDRSAEQLDTLFARHQRYMVRLRLEAARLLRGPKDEIRNVTCVSGLEHLQAALAGGRGALVVGRHEGMWWHAPSGLAVHGHAVQSVFNSFPLRSIEDYLIKYAGRRGVALSLVQRGAAEAMRAASRSNGVFYVSVDLPVRDEGATLYPMGPVDVPLERGPAILARRLNMPIVPVTCEQVAGGLSSVMLSAPVDPMSATADELCRAWVADLHERLLTRPEQWWAWGFTQLRRREP